MQSQTKSIGPYKLEFDNLLLDNDLQHISRDELKLIGDFLYQLELQKVPVTVDCNGHVQNIYYRNHVIQIYKKHRVIGIKRVPVPTATT